MSSALTIVLVGILPSVLLASGVVIGRYFLSVDKNRKESAGLDGVHLHRFARRLHQLAGSVADDVGQHQAKIQQVSKDLTAANKAEHPPLTEVVLGAIARVVESNAQLQQRLTVAETRLQQHAEQIRAQISEARTDPLTDLPNRRAFEDELDRRIAEWRRKRIPFSLMMIDVDHFKLLNDRYGHPAGDAVLRSISDVIKTTLRTMDMVARVGGEEFAVILPSMSVTDAILATTRARQAVESHELRFEQWDLKATVSVGLAPATPGDDATSLVKRADEALYASKRRGRNCGHLHNGRMCERIDVTAEAAGSHHHPASSDVQAEDTEMLAVSLGLRSRLAELTEHDAPDAAAGVSGRN
jgi:diguanylate cyclase